MADKPTVTGNIDMSKRPRVRNKDGSISTVRSMSFQDDDGLEVLIPTVSDDGKVLSDKAAIDLYYQTGKHLGKFKTPAAATSFAESLHKSEEQKLMADKKKSKGADYSTFIETELKGLGPALVVKGNLSDEEWSKRRSEAGGETQDDRFKGDKDKQVRAIFGDGDYIQIKDKTGRTFSVVRRQPNESEGAWAQKIARARKMFPDNIEDIRVGGKSIEKSDENVVDTTETPFDERAALLEHIKKGGVPNMAGFGEAEAKALRELVKTSPEKAVDFVMKRKQGAESKPAEQPSEGGMSVRGQMMRLMKGATGKQSANDMSAGEGVDLTNPNDMSAGEGIDLTQPAPSPEGSNPKLNQLAAQQAAQGGLAREANFTDGTTIEPRSLSPEGSNPQLNQMAQTQANTRQYGQGGVVDPGMEDIPLSLRGQLMEAAAPITNFAQGLGDMAAGGVNAINEIPGKFGRAVANTILPDSGEPVVRNADPLETGIVPSAPGTAPVVGGQVVPPGGVPLPGMSGGLSVGSKTRTPGAVPPAQAAADYSKELLGHAERAKKLNEAGAELALSQAGAEERVLRDQMERQSRLEKENLERQAIVEKHIADREMGLQSLQSDVLALSKESIDPNRFWNNKDAGQKASAVIAGALFGFTGQGMQWLQRLDGLVQDDVRMQMADRQYRAGQLDKAVGVQKDLIGMAEVKGLRGTAAYNASVVALKSQMADQLRLNAARYAQPEIRLKSEQMALALDQSALKDKMNFDRQSKLDAADLSYKYAQAANLRANTAETYAKMQAAKGGAGGKLEQIRGPQVQTISDLMNALKSARNMSTSFKNKASGFISKIAALDPTGSTDASQFNARRDVAVQLIGRALEGGKLAEGDIGRYQEMIPKAGDLRGAERWDQLITELEQRLATDVQSFESAGFDTGGLKQQAVGVLRGGNTPSTERPAEE